MDWSIFTNTAWYLYAYGRMGAVGTIVAGVLVLLLSKWACEAWAAISGTLLHGLWALVLKPLGQLLGVGVRWSVRRLYHRWEPEEVCEICAPNAS